MTAKTKKSEAQDAAMVLQSVVEQENLQEQRVQDALSQHAVDEEKRRRANQEEMQRQEQMILSAAREELQAYAQKEPAAILTAAQERSRSEASSLQASSKKNTASVSKDLLKSLLHFSFLSRS